MTFIQDLLDIQVPKEVKLSPDGTQVIYSTSLPWGYRKGEYDLSTIWLADASKERSARQLTSGLYNDRSPRWAPDGKSIAFLSDRAKASNSSAVYVLPIAGGEAYPITPAENEQSISKFEFSPDGKFLAFLSPDEKTAERKGKDKEGDDAQVWGEDWPFNRLRIVHVETRKIETLVSGDSHVTYLAWKGDGRAIAFFETNTPDIESNVLHGVGISVLDLVSKHARKILQFPNRADKPVWIGESLYFIASAVAELSASANTVYAIDMAVKEPVYKKHAHGDVDCAFGLGKAGTVGTVMVQHGLEDQIRLLGGKTLFSKKRAIAAWDIAWPENKDPVLSIVQGDVNNPAEVFTIAASDGEMVQLSDHGAIFGDQTFGSVSFLSCQSLDKKDTLDGLFLTPASHASSAGAPKKPIPTVVFIHGGPYSRKTDAFDDGIYSNPAFLHAGYGVLLPNYRGGSSHGETHAKYQRGGMGVQDESDIVALTQHVIERGFADREKLIVAGYSQGGFLSYLSATRNGLHGFGWKFRAAIPGAGVADWGAMAQTSDIGLWESELAGNGPWNMDKSDVSDRQGSALYELKKAAQIGGVVPPMLILHGEKDVRVPIEQARGFRRGLDFWKLPYEYVIYPREGHLFKEQRHIRDMMERILAFCDKHVG